jgi:hypothetical protein
LANTSIVVNDYLTWEYCNDPEIQYLDCPAPMPIKDAVPKWVKNLKGDFSQYCDTSNFEYTIRHCLGFQGILNLGYTIPLPETLDGYDTRFAQGRLHPAMVTGTKWANKLEPGWAAEFDDSSEYEYRFRLLHWPWRARMAKGWQLLILPFLLDWSSDWHEFAGAVPPNYDIQNGTQIGSGLSWDIPIDPDYNYYNLETVVAYKRSVNIDKGTTVFCALPYFNPELYEKQTNEKDT